uniref:RNA-directed DNA polymerase n=1 Tax=Tanacetum cinerariifolium TaxID=118510 RepID=A0A6L2JWV5_TANCI|nr:reverse transcriptase domain-containing protein [Tanacetum cinerariifolium]
MSNTNKNLQTQTSNALHNAIMEAGGKDPPPMLALVTTFSGNPESRDISTPNLTMRSYTIVPRIHLINSNELKEQFHLQKFLHQLQPEWQMFVTLVKQSQELKTVSYHNLYDILKQHQNKVNDIRVKRLARKAIVSSPQPTYNQEPTMVAEDDEMSKEKEIDKLMDLISVSFKKIYKPTSNNLKTLSNTSRANQDNTLRINRGIGYDNQRAVNVVGARENVGTHVVQQYEIRCYNCKEYGHVARECQKPKWAKDAAYHKKKMLLCKQEEAGFQLNAEQADWRDDTNDEPNEQELQAHYMYMVKIQEVSLNVADNFGPIFDAKTMPKVQNDDDNYNVFANDREHPEQPESVNDTHPNEQGDTNITTDSLDISNNKGEDVQDDDDDLARERDLLASLIGKLKCGIDESKDSNKLLESSNKTLVDKSKSEIEDFKNKNKCLESSNNHFKETNTELAKNNQLMFKDLKNFQSELDRRSNRRRIPNIVEPEIRTIEEVVPMADRTMEELLQAPTEGESSSRTDDRIDKLADQILNLLKIVNKQVITPATAKAVEKTCVIYGGDHAYYDCIATDSNQSSVSAATGTYNQVSPPNRASNQIPPPDFAPVQNNQNSFADALLLMPKFASMIKSLLTNKDKLFELAKVPLNENCPAMLLKKLPEKLGDPGKFLIPCNFPRIDVCHALADLGASINLMPLSIWKNLSLPELTPTQMTLDLVDRSITRPKGVAEDVFVKVGKFHFPTDFVVVDFEADPRVPLILGRSFLRTGHVIDIACEEFVQDVLDFQYNSKSSNPTLPVGSPIHCVPKKGDMTVVANENNELIPTRLVTGWRVYIDYRKLNDATRKDHFTLPFMDQMLERLAINEFYCFLDGFLGYFQISIDPQDQEKTTFTCPYGTFAYRRMPFGLCNALGTFQRCMIAIFHDMIEKTMEVFMDGFLLTEAPILVMPDWNLPFELMCDASDFAIGAVLGQRKTKHFQPIHYASKTMTEAQIHYTMTEKMLIVVYAFEKFRPYLVLFKSIVYTDHSNLKYLLSKQDAKPRLLRWVLLLQEFDITIHDKKGSENLAADHLSRLENPHKDVLENKDINENFPLEILGSLSSGSTPWAIISDRGTHFCNDQFARVMTKYGVTHRLVIAYHPQTSGQVEVSNRGLKRILERTVGENRASWSDKLDYALWAFRTAFKTPIGCTPYKLVYGKSCHLPIELEHKVYWALKHVNFDLKTAGDHQKLQLNELNELRNQAYENSLIYKEKTKKLHDSKIKNRIFNVGDQVLLFNSRLKIFSRKLKTHWSGPFTITQVFPYGTVELSQPDGPNFKVNSHRVKHYFGGDIPSKVVPDLYTIPMDK